MLNIGQVARQTGIRTSAIRYYESIGLLPQPERQSGRRIYDESVLQRLAVIQTAQKAGFSLDEMHLLFENTGVSWQVLIQRKIQEMNTLLQSIQSMKTLLEDMMACDDPHLADCIMLTGQKHQLIR